MGEFGVNDYHFFFPTKSVQEIMSFVPDVIGTISMAIEVLQVINHVTCTALHNNNRGSLVLMI
jgi:hypothetical protein